MVIGKLYDSLHIHIDLLTDGSQGIDESEVDVAVGVLGEFGKLSFIEAGGKDFTVDEASIEGLGLGGTLFGEAADDTRVMSEFIQRIPGKDALGAMGQVIVFSGFESGTAKDSGNHFLAAAWGNGGFHNDKIAGLNVRHDRCGGGLNETQVGFLSFAHRGRNGYEKNISLRGGFTGYEVSVEPSGL